MVPHIFVDFLNNGSTDNANVDGSSVAVSFDFTATRSLVVRRMIIHVDDTGTFTATSYGALSELTNGILVQHIAGSTTTDLLAGHQIKAHVEWQRFAHDLEERSPSGGGAKTVSARWSFSKFAPRGLGRDGLILETNEKLRVVVRDNLTGLTEHYFCVQGYYL